MSIKEDKKSAVVVIPIYQSNPPQEEIASFRQCLNVLNAHDIVIVTYDSLDCSIYDKIAIECSKNIFYTFFDMSFFNGIMGYNRLCLNSDFYKRFQQYEYMLIYQLDAWVFKDELALWCSKGYDYIGAPWFRHFGRYEDGNKFMAVGNGGFSLRRIEKMICILTSHKPLYRKYPLKINSVWRMIHAFFFHLGFHNNIRNTLHNNKMYEDILLCIEFDKTRMKLKKPDLEEASKFAFEKSPSYLFEITKHKLPFGCHAFMKNDFETFWKEYIII